MGQTLLCFLFSLISGFVWAVPVDSMNFQEFRSSMQELGYQVHAQATELRLLEERIAELEKQETLAPKQITPSPKRESDLAADIKKLKQYLDQTDQSLRHMEQRLTQLDRQVEQDLTAVKKSLKEMVLLLTLQESSDYIVQPGDSLGTIAMHKKLSVKQLKEWNQLQTDTIFPGQKLKLMPSS